MADVSVAPYRNGQMEIKKGFDVGAGPSRGFEDAVRSLEDLAEDGELDEALVRRVAWMQDWEDIVLGVDPPDNWTREQGGDTVTAVCDPAELGRILDAMTLLRPHVGSSHLASWDKLSTFLASCAENGGTVCLWYDPMG